MSKQKNTKSDGNIFDRIFKENIEPLFLPLVEMELGFKIKSFKALPAKFSKTIEREVDSIYRIITEDDEEKLLNLEFQTQDDPNMLYRIVEYNGLAYRKYKLPIIHVVIYLGTGVSKMKKKMDEAAIFKGFDLINLHQLDTDKLLQSQVPEMIILALLSNFEPERIEPVLRLIIKRLKLVAKSESDLRKYVAQITHLSRLRKVDVRTKQIIQAMPILLDYDMEQDAFYKEGFEKGIEKGIEKGFEKGIEKGIEKTKKKAELQAEKAKKKAIQEMLSSKMLTYQQIAKFMSVTATYVKQVEQEMKQKKSRKQ